MAFSTINPVLFVAGIIWCFMIGLTAGYWFVDKFLRYPGPNSDKVLIKGVVTCTLCGSDADVYLNRYQCQKDPHHLAFKDDKTFFLGSIWTVRHDQQKARFPKLRKWIPKNENSPSQKRERYKVS